LNLIINVVLLSFFAGLGTGIGGLIVILLGKVSDRFIASSMGFASGVMLIVSFLNLFVEALELTSYLNVATAFFVGSLFMILVDLFLPHLEFGKKESGIIDSKLFKSGLLILIGITIHNLPEGVIIGVGYAHLPQLGTLIAIAIFFHNLPEGIATAVPLLSARIKKLNVLLLTVISGLAEPIGAVLGGTILISATDEAIGLVLAFAAGVMTYITADELLPIAHERGYKKEVSISLLIGIAFILFLNNFFRH
jgi:ZIP family zinc transporter